MNIPRYIFVFIFGAMFFSSCASQPKPPEEFDVKFDKFIQREFLGEVIP